MKKTLYFPHDYNARHDPKLERLYLKYGYEGKGIYWDLIEMLYEQGGYLNIKDIPLYAHGDDKLCERITSVIKEFGLFEISEAQFWSKSCLKRLEWITDKSQKATSSINKRWHPDTNVLPTNYEGNTINKEINKQIKIEEIRTVINRLVEIKGWDKTDSTLLTDVYKRHSRAAKALILLTGGAEKSCEIMNKLNEQFSQKGLSWTLETVIKWYPEFSKKKPIDRGDV